MKLQRDTQALSELIEWSFDEKKIEIRHEIRAMSISPEELIEDKVQRRIDAFFPPKVPILSMKIFNFFVETQKYTINAGGMEHYVIGLDIQKIGDIGMKYYNIDLSRYKYFFDFFEEKLLDQQQKRRDQKR